MGILDELIQDCKQIVLPLIGQEVPMLIDDVVIACWPEGKRPLLHKKHKLTQGWEFVYSLPPGMTFKDFCTRSECFKDAIGDCVVDILHSGKMAILKINTNQIADKYVFDFDAIKKSKHTLPIQIGYTHNGLIIEDLAQIPHILIGGITGGGKSNSIHVIINSLLHSAKPPKIVVIDLKQLEYSYL